MPTARKQKTVKRAPPKHDWLGWHFLNDDRRLRYGDKKLVRRGQLLKVKPPLIMCEHGLHASAKALDALGYASGAIVCRVSLGGEILHDGDKGVRRWALRAGDW